MYDPGGPGGLAGYLHVMKLHINKRSDLLLVHSCTSVAGVQPGSSPGAAHDGEFLIRIGETEYRQSIILTSRSVDLWEVRTARDLDESHISRLAESGAEIIIIGTGRSITFPNQSLMRPLSGKRIGVEIMDTPAACRTYNILAGDSRNVVAALMC